MNRGVTVRARALTPPTTRLKPDPPNMVWAKRSTGETAATSPRAARTPRRPDPTPPERREPKAAIMKKYTRGVKEIGGYPVTGRLDTDGFKFFVDHGWVLVRASGTEPLIRFYAEADSMAKVDALLAAATKV